MTHLDDAIRLIWRDIPLVAPEDIVDIGGGYIDPEREEVKNFFSGRSWRGIMFEEVKAFYSKCPSSILPFLKPEAKRYYFPAFLLITLSHYKDSDVIGTISITQFSDSNILHLPGRRPSLKNGLVLSEDELCITHLVFASIKASDGYGYDPLLEEAIRNIFFLREVSKLQTYTSSNDLL